MYATAPTRAYRESAILTASPARLVVMLYDGVRRFLTQGAQAMGERDIARANERLKRAEAIIDELLSTLDMSQGELSQRLSSIYLFSRRLLVEARLEQDPERIRQVIELFAELRDAWAEIAAQ